MELRAAAFALAALLAACAEPPAPIAAVTADFGRLGDLYFGLPAGELRDLRPEVELSPENVYREWLSVATVVSYGFLPWVDGEAPARQASLEGVEIRKEVADSVSLLTAWGAAVAEASRTASHPPQCSETRDFRVHLRRAVFPDSLRVTVLAEVVISPDGQEHEAFLTARVETPSMVRASPGGGGASPGAGPIALDCPAG